MTGAESDAGLPPGMTPASWAWKEVQFSLYVCRRVSVSPASPVSRVRPRAPLAAVGRVSGEANAVGRVPGEANAAGRGKSRGKKGWRR